MKNHRTDWIHLVLVAFALICTGLVVMLMLGGCQSTTSIKGGESSAQATREEVRPKSTTTTTIEIVLPKEAK